MSAQKKGTVRGTKGFKKNLLGFWIQVCEGYRRLQTHLGGSGSRYVRGTEGFQAHLGSRFQVCEGYRRVQAHLGGSGSRYVKGTERLRLTWEALDPGM